MIFVPCLIAGLALAKPPPLVQRDEVRDAAGFGLEVGAVKVRLDSGQAVRFSIPESETHGIWMAGEGSTTITFPNRGEALRWGNRQVLLFGRERAKVAPEVSSGVVTTSADRVMVLSSATEIDELFQGMSVVDLPAPGALEERLRGWDRPMDGLTVHARTDRRMGLAPAPKDGWVAAFKGENTHKSWGGAGSNPDKLAFDWTGPTTDRNCGWAPIRRSLQITVQKAG